MRILFLISDDTTPSLQTCKEVLIIPGKLFICISLLSLKYAYKLRHVMATVHQSSQDRMKKFQN